MLQDHASLCVQKMPDEAVVFWISRDTQSESAQPVTLHVVVSQLYTPSEILLNLLNACFLMDSVSHTPFQGYTEMQSLVNA